MIADIGDWIRFYQNGTLVIGTVEYIDKDNLGFMHYKTSIGSTREDYILEVRKKPMT